LFHLLGEIEVVFGFWAVHKTLRVLPLPTPVASAAKTTRSTAWRGAAAGWTAALFGSKRANSGFDGHGEGSCDGVEGCMAGGS
jgi:hypothetical protein